MSNTNEYIFTKAVLTFDEAVAYTGFSASYLYKLTAGKKIPHSKPNGKSIFFDRKELEDWLMGNRIPVATDENKETWNREDIEDLVRWVCSKYGNGIDTEAAINAISKFNEKGKRLSPDFVLDYLYEHYDLDLFDRKELEYDKKILRDEKARREALGLPLFPADWTIDVTKIFLDLQLDTINKHDWSRRFYDTDGPHSIEATYQWISENVFHGKKTPQELMELARKNNPFA